MSLQSLPEPDADARAHSEQLTHHIRTVIDEHGGAIDFAHYMNLVLYAPGLGYYSAGAAKFGEPGDFITAPEISPLFGRCLARQCRDILEHLQDGDILELGAGSGKLAVDLLRELGALASLPRRYLILETSADLRERQQSLLREQLPDFYDNIVWLDALPSEPITGIVIANEVLDALPVHCIDVTPDDTAELMVANAATGFEWQTQPLAGQVKTVFDEVLGELPEPLPNYYRTEVNVGLADWLSAVAGTLASGVMLFIDYGYPRSEYYHPQRDSGTLICHYRHRAHQDPFLYPGLQDISTSVDFTRLAEAALIAGLSVAGFTTQSHFLIGCGIDSMVNEMTAMDERQRMSLSREMKQLTLPSEMGERFKVMALTRACDLPLTAMQQADFRHRL